MALLVCLLAGGCGGGGRKVVRHKPCEKPKSGQELKDAVVILIDRSKSTGTPEIRAQYTAAVGQVLQYLEDEGKSLIAIAPIDSDSRAHFAPAECVFPEKTSSSNPIVYKGRAANAKRDSNAAAQKIIQGKRTTRGTTVLDALTSAGQLLHKEKGYADHRYLVVLSDMIEESDRFTMSAKNLQPAAVARFIREDQSGPEFPNLDGVTVYIAGVGVTTNGSSLQTRDIKTFWLSYLAKTGGRLDPDNFASSLAFP